jgi:hypothetical protein
MRRFNHPMIHAQRVARGSVALSIVLLLLSCGGPSGPVVEAPSFAEAQRLATERDGLIVVDFWRDG